MAILFILVFMSLILSSIIEITQFISFLSRSSFLFRELRLSGVIKLSTISLSGHGLFKTVCWVLGLEGGNPRKMHKA